MCQSALLVAYAHITLHLRLWVGDFQNGKLVHVLIP